MRLWVTILLKPARVLRGWVVHNAVWSCQYNGRPLFARAHAFHTPDGRLFPRLNLLVTAVGVL
jgi:hypothetical protein